MRRRYREKKAQERANAVSDENKYSSVVELPAEPEVISNSFTESSLADDNTYSDVVEQPVEPEEIIENNSSSHSSEEVKNIIRDYIFQYLGIENTPYPHNYSLDNENVNVWQLATDFEKNTGVKLNDSQIKRCKTVGAFVSMCYSVFVLSSNAKLDNLVFASDSNNGNLRLYSEVVDIIADKLGVEPYEVTLEADIRDDLGADSLDAMELIMAFEHEFGISIPEEIAEKVQTVEDIMIMLQSYGL